MASPPRSPSPPPVNVLVPPRPLLVADAHRDSESFDQVDMEQDELMDEDDRIDQHAVNTTSGQQQPNEAIAAAVTSESGTLIASADAGASSTGLDSRSAAGGAESMADGLAPRKRKRLTRACDSCRRRKIKCDGLSGCGPCRAQAVECTYNDVMRKRGPRNGRKSGSVAESAADVAAAVPTASQTSLAVSTAAGPAQHAIHPIPIVQQLHDDPHGPIPAPTTYTHPHHATPAAYSYHSSDQQLYQNRQHLQHQAAPLSPVDLSEYQLHAHRHSSLSSIHPAPFPHPSSGASRIHGRDHEFQARMHHDPRPHSHIHFAPAHPQFGPSPNNGRFLAGAPHPPAQDAPHQAYRDHSPKYHGPPMQHAHVYREGDAPARTSPARPLFPPKTNGLGGSEFSSGYDRQPSFGAAQRPLRLELVRLALHHYAASDLSALDPPSIRSWAFSRPLDSAQLSPRHPSWTLGLAIASYMCRAEGHHFYASTSSAPVSALDVSEWIALASGTALTDMTVRPEAVLTLLLLTRAELLVGNIASAWRLVGGAWTSVQLLRDCATVDLGLAIESQRPRKRSSSGSPVEHHSLDPRADTKFPMDELVLAAVAVRSLVATVLGASVSVDSSSALASGTPLSPHDSIRASQRDLTLAISRAVQFVNAPNPQSSVRSLVADIERCITACPEPLVFPPADPTLLVASIGSHVQAHAALIMLARPAVLSALNLFPASPSNHATYVTHGDFPTPRSPGEFDILFSAMSRSTGALVRVAQWISAQPAVHDARLRHALTVLAPMLANAMYQAATGVAMIVVSSAQKQQTHGRDSSELPHHQSAAKSLVTALEVVMSAFSAHTSSSIVDRYLGTVAQLSARLGAIPAGSLLPTEFLLPLHLSDSASMRATNSTMGLPLYTSVRAPAAISHAPDARQSHALNVNRAPAPMDRSDWRMHGPAPGRLSGAGLPTAHHSLPLPISDSPSHSASCAPRLSQPLGHSQHELHRPMLPPISSLLPKPDQATVNGSTARDASHTSFSSHSPPAPAPVNHTSNGGESPNGRQAESPGLAMLRMAAVTMSDSGFEVRSAAVGGGSRRE